MKLLLISFLFFFTINSALAQNNPYSFFVAGHVYGKPGVNNTGVHPPFKQKFSYIQSRPEIILGVFTGDIVFPNPVAQDWDEIDADIDTLGLPVYFAVGNHDMENRPLYESRYGDTYYSFLLEGDLFIVLDPNIDEWNISGDQLTFFDTTLTNHADQVDNIFVFFHQLLWWESDNIYAGYNPNSFAGRADSINFWSEIEPLAHQLSNNVVFITGDIGSAPWSSDFMYDNYDNITFIASGMGDVNGENFVVVNIDSTNSLSYDLICLGDTDMNCFGELTDYQISEVISVNEIMDIKDNVTLFPNPATHSFNIQFNREINATVQIFDIKGQLLIEEKNDYNTLHQVNVTHLNSGIYFVRISDENTNKVIKLIVN